MPSGRYAWIDDEIPRELAGELAREHYPGDFAGAGRTPDGGLLNYLQESFEAGATTSFEKLPELGSAIEASFGGEGAEGKRQEAYLSLQKEARERAAEIGDSPGWESVTDAWERGEYIESAGDALKAVAGMTAQSAGFMAPPMATALTVGSLGGGPIGAFLAGTGMFALQHFAETLSTDIETGGLNADPEELRIWQAAAAAAPMAVLDQLLPLASGMYGAIARKTASRALVKGLMEAGEDSAMVAAIAKDAGASSRVAMELGKEMGEGAQAAIGRSLKHVARAEMLSAGPKNPFARYIAASMGEGTTEMGQQALQRAGAGLALSMDDEDFISEMIESFAGGALLGPIFTGGVDIAGRVGEARGRGEDVRTTERSVAGAKELRRVEKDLEAYKKESEVARVKAREEAEAKAKEDEAALAPTGPTREDVHKAADDRNILWDDDPGFMSMTARVTAKKGARGQKIMLDDLDQKGLKKVFDELMKYSVQEAPTSLDVLAPNGSELAEYAKLFKGKGKKKRAVTKKMVRDKVRANHPSWSLHARNAKADAIFGRMKSQGIITRTAEGWIVTTPTRKHTKAEYNRVREYARRNDGKFPGKEEFGKLTGIYSPEMMADLRSELFDNGEILRDVGRSRDAVVSPTTPYVAPTERFEVVRGERAAGVPLVGGDATKQGVLDAIERGEDVPIEIASFVGRDAVRALREQPAFVPQPGKLEQKKFQYRTLKDFQRASTVEIPGREGRRESVEGVFPTEEEAVGVAEGLAEEARETPREYDYVVTKDGVDLLPAYATTEEAEQRVEVERRAGAKVPYLPPHRKGADVPVEARGLPETYTIKRRTTRERPATGAVTGVDVQVIPDADGGFAVIEEQRGEDGEFLGADRVGVFDTEEEANSAKVDRERRRGVEPEVVEEAVEGEFVGQNWRDVEGLNAERDFLEGVTSMERAREKIREIKGVGRDLDEAGVVAGEAEFDIFPFRPGDERDYVRVVYPNGEVVVFYLSSKGTSGKVAGEWYPVNAFATEEIAPGQGAGGKNWLVKDNLVLDHYNSRVFRDTAREIRKRVFVKDGVFALARKSRPAHLPDTTVYIGASNADLTPEEYMRREEIAPESAPRAPRAVGIPSAEVVDGGADPVVEEAPVESNEEVLKSLMARLKKHLKNTGWGDALEVKVEEFLKSDSNEAVSGKFEPQRLLISLSMDVAAGKTDNEIYRTLRQNMNHELIHVLGELNLLSDAEWSTLEKFVSKQTFKVDGKDMTYLEYVNQDPFYEKLSAEEKVEEAIAVAFQNWKRPDVTKKAAGKPASLLRRMFDALKKIGTGFRKSEYNSADEIFAALWTPEVASRLGESTARRRRSRDEIMKSLQVQEEREALITEAKEEMGTAGEEAATRKRPKGAPKTDWADRFSKVSWHGPEVEGAEAPTRPVESPRAAKGLEEEYDPSFRAHGDPLPRMVRAYHGGGRQIGESWNPREAHKLFGGTGERYPGGGPQGRGTYFMTARVPAEIYLKYGGDSPVLSEVEIDTSNMVTNSIKSPLWERFRAVQREIMAQPRSWLKPPANGGTYHLEDLWYKYRQTPALVYDLLDRAGITGKYTRLPMAWVDMDGREVQGVDEIVVYDESVISDVIGPTERIPVSEVGSDVKSLYNLQNMSPEAVTPVANELSGEPRLDFGSLAFNRDLESVDSGQELEVVMMEGANEVTEAGWNKGFGKEFIYADRGDRSSNASTIRESTPFGSPEEALHKLVEEVRLSAGPMHPRWNKQMRTAKVDYIKDHLDRAGIVRINLGNGRVMIAWDGPGFDVPLSVIFDQINTDSGSAYTVASVFADNKPFLEDRIPQDLRSNGVPLHGPNADLSSLIRVMTDRNEKVSRAKKRERYASASIPITTDPTIIETVDAVAPYKPYRNILERMIQPLLEVEGFKELATKIRADFFDALFPIEGSSAEVAKKMRDEGRGLVYEYSNVTAIGAARFRDNARAYTAGTITDGYLVYQDGFPKIIPFEYEGDSYRGIPPAGLRNMFLPLRQNDIEINYWQTYAMAVRADRLRDPTSKSVHKEYFIVENPKADKPRLVPMNTDQIKAGLKIGEDFPVVKEVYENWQRFNDHHVQFMRDTGVIDDKMAELFSLYGDYIPFYINMEGKDSDVIRELMKRAGAPEGAKLFKKFAGATPPPKYEGHTRLVMDPMESIVRNIESLVWQGLSNVATQRAVADQDYLERAKRVINPPPVFHGISFRVDGVEQHWELDDPLMVRALLGSVGGNNIIKRFLGVPANILREWVTRSPAFMWRNTQRDSVSQWNVSGANILPLISGMKRAFGNVTDAAVGRKSETLSKMHRLGVGYGVEFAGTERATRSLQKDFRKKRSFLRKKGKHSNSTGVLGKIWDKAGDMSSATEMSTRQAVFEDVYKKVLDRTGDTATAEAEAAMQAIEVMNFGRRGGSELLGYFTLAIPFLNARLQGLDVFYRAATGKFSVDRAQSREQILRNFWMRGLYLSAASAGYTLLQWDDEDYRRATQLQRDNNWIMPGGWLVAKPFETGIAFGLVPELVVGSFLGNSSRDTVTSLKQAFWSTLNLNPFGIQVSKPMLEVYTDYSNLWGGPIVGEYGDRGMFSGVGLDPRENYLFRKLGGITGTNPKVYEHLVSGYTGTLGMFMADIMGGTAQAVDSAIFGGDSPTTGGAFSGGGASGYFGEIAASVAAGDIGAIPFGNALRMKDVSRGYKEQFYALRELTRDMAQTLNGLERSGRYDEMYDLMAEYPGIVGMTDIVNDLDKTLSDVRAQKQMLIDYGMDPMVADKQRRGLEKYEDQLLRYLPELMDKQDLPWPSLYPWER